MKGFCMFGMNERTRSFWSTVAGSLLIVGCSSKIVNQAPVEDRSAIVSKTATASNEVPAPVIKQLPGFENAGKPGYYTVKPGDTLTRIGLDHGQAPKDIARWSNIENPNRIEIGQVLRVDPPVITGAVSKPVPAANTSAITAAALPSIKPAASAPIVASTPVVPGAAASVEEEIGWIWPTSGQVLTGFDELKNKGLDIGGNAGDPVLAAADGRVVYVGAGLRGYGNLIILKHNNTYLTAYAHNRTLLIKEDQSVRKGQKIAEMGSSDSDRVKLHFEVRRQGKPVDPAKYLPAR
jgi:lipoprotein NlpD